MLYWLSRFLVSIWIKACFRLKVRGRENIPKQGAFILASNHVSILDPMILGVGSFRRLDYIAKEELFKNPFFAWLIRHLGAFPLRRKSADVSALKEALNRLKRGRPVVIFPQGGRRRDINEEIIYAGVGFLAQHADVPIVPAYIHYIMGKNKKTIFPKRLELYFGEKIFAKGGVEYSASAAQVIAAIKDLAKNTSFN